MRRIGVFTLFFTLLVLIGAQAGSASAATDLELSAEGAALEAGTPIETVSSGMTITTGAGDVTCGESVMEGTIKSNNSTKDVLQFTSAQFRKERHWPKAECESTLALGEPTVTAIGLPWTLELTTKAHGKFKGSKKPGITLAFASTTCILEGTSATDTFNLPLGEEAVPLEISLTGLELKLSKASGPGCPGSGVFEEPGIAVSDQAQTSDKVNVKKTKPKK